MLCIRGDFYENIDILGNFLKPLAKFEKVLYNEQEKDDCFQRIL